MSCKYLLTEETVSRRHRLVPLAAGVFLWGGDYSLTTFSSKVTPLSVATRMM